MPKKPISKLKVLDYVWAKRPDLDFKTLGYIDHIAEINDKPFYVVFNRSDEFRFNEDELELADERINIRNLKERIFDFESKVSDLIGGYDCVIYDYNHLEDAVYGLLKRWGEKSDITPSIERLVSLLGGAETVKDVIDDVYKDGYSNY